MRIVILTSDVTDWALQGWFCLLNKYWPEHPPVVVGGFTPPKFPLDAEFIRLGRFVDYPVTKWSDALIALLEAIPDEFFIWTMDDFWLLRRVDDRGVRLLWDYISSHSELARIDLTADRVLAHGARDAGVLDHLQLITNEHPVPYLLSLQTGIWRKSALRAYLVPGESPWQVELEGTTRMLRAGANVLGTREVPVRHLIAIQQGRLALDGGYQGTEYALSHEDEIELRQKGFLRS